MLSNDNSVFILLTHEITNNISYFLLGRVPVESNSCRSPYQIDKIIRNIYQTINNLF